MLWLSLSNDYSPEVRWTTCPCDWSHRRLEKFTKMRHIGDVSETWILHRRTSTRSTLTDVPCVREICLGISSSPVFYSPDDWGWKEVQQEWKNETEVGRWRDVAAMRGRGKSAWWYKKKNWKDEEEDSGFLFVSSVCRVCVQDTQLWGPISGGNRWAVHRVEQMAPRNTPKYNPITWIHVPPSG